jgi:hypothetical protein
MFSFITCFFVTSVDLLVEEAHVILNYFFLATNDAYNTFTNKGMGTKAGTIQTSSLRLLYLVCLTFIIITILFYHFGEFNSFETFKFLVQN